jgi:hypothetical protein
LIFLRDSLHFQAILNFASQVRAMQVSVYEKGAAHPFIPTLAFYSQGGGRLDTFSGRTRQ